MTKQTEALKELLEIVEHAIIVGDWKVDGACDPEMIINACEEALALSEKQHTFLDKCIAEIDAEIERNGGAWIEQPAQEPVAWLYKRENSSGGWYVVTNYDKEHDNGNRNIECYDIPLYTHPCALARKAPPCQECENLKHDLEGYMEANKALINREWVGLSGEELENIKDEVKSGWYDFARAIEQALKDKNNAV